MNAHMAIRPAPEEAALFRAQGFVRLRGLLSRDEVADMEEAFEAAVRTATGHGSDVAGIVSGRADLLVTVVSPEASVPILRSSRLVSEARRVMSVFFEVPEERLLCGWRCFLKPSGGDVTPWHQDAAYRPPPYHGGTVWLPSIRRRPRAAVSNICRVRIGGRFSSTWFTDIILWPSPPVWMRR